MKLIVGNKHLTMKKWKGKDKKNFINALKKKDIDENEVMQSLVYSCIEEAQALSVDEFKYVLSRIRAESLGEEINIEFYCASCGELYTKTFLLKDIISYSYNELKEIKVNDVHIVLGEIRNKDFYIKKIAEDEIFDLLLRIKSINGNDTFTLDELVEMFDDMEIDTLDKVLEIYNESKFKVLDVNTVKCPSCSKETKYKFDELPGFFPQSWFDIK
jgi:hypothetical protein